MTACNRIAVLIPARNEEALLPRCLRSVLRAKSMLPTGIACDIVVVSDASTDRTEKLARSLLKGHGGVLRVHAGCVGKARQAAAAAVLAQLSAQEAASCWLANTDADCIVPETWLQHQLRLSGVCGAVTGVVDVDSFHEHLPHVAARFSETYKLDPQGTHPHVHGANLGVRADAYLLAGGWDGQHTGEDHHLWNRLRSVGAVCLSDASLRVTTSGRRVGRAPHGFADALAAHNDYKPAMEAAV